MANVDDASSASWRSGAHERLRVTIVANEVGGLGGMERHLDELISGLLARGARVTVVARACTLSAHPHLRFRRLRGPSRPFTLAYCWFFLAGSLLTIRREDRLLHATGAIIANRVDISTVHLLHHAVHGTRQRRASRDSLLFRINARMAEALSMGGERWCYRPGRAGRLVAVSDGVASEVATHFPAMASLTQVIHNGVDTLKMRPDSARRRAARGRWGIADTDLVAIFMGGDWDRKGLSVAIDAIAACPSWVLVVGGQGDRRSALSAAKRAGLGSRLRLLGPVDHSEEHYAGADVFILPTAYETFSLATYEAAACGLPLLATRVSGINDILRDGVNGWFIDRNVSSIVPHLQQLEADTALRLRMGHEARESVLSYTWRRMVERHVDLYMSLGTLGEQPV